MSAVPDQQLLESPKTSFMHICSVYFPISFVAEAGKRVTKDTNPLWSDFPLLLFSLRDYNIKKVKLTNNKEKDKLIVFG